MGKFVQFLHKSFVNIFWPGYPVSEVSECQDIEYNYFVDIYISVSSKDLVDKWICNFDGKLGSLFVCLGRNYDSSLTVIMVFIDMLKYWI